MTQKEFIDIISPLAIKAYKTLGKVKPSVCIGMACVECRYGNAGSVKYNSLLGQKVGTGKTATKYWNGTSFNSKTKEEYILGVHTTIKANFRSYESFEQCIFNYYELLNTSLYKKVLSTSTYDEQMKQIKQCGYMTSSTEVNSVLWYINKFNLTKYDTMDIVDDELEVDKVVNLSTGEIIQQDDVYVVKKGDTLWGIALKYLGSGLKWKTIYDYNDLDSTTIYIGQRIKIPK